MTSPNTILSGIHPRSQKRLQRSNCCGHTRHSPGIIGARFEGSLRKVMILHDGYIRDSNVYSILDHEWQSVKARLIALLDEKENGDGSESIS